MFSGMEELFVDASTSRHQKWVKLKEQLQSEGYSFTLE
jgi:hypothetical protein